MLALLGLAMVVVFTFLARMLKTEYWKDVH